MTIYLRRHSIASTAPGVILRGDLPTHPSPALPPCVRPSSPVPPRPPLPPLPLADMPTPRRAPAVHPDARIRPALGRCAHQRADHLWCLPAGTDGCARGEKSRQASLHGLNTDKPLS